MRSTADILRSVELPARDAYDLPSSPKRFADGGQYRIEIPSCEGPRAMEAVVAAAREHGIAIHRISQGSGAMLQTGDEIRRMVALGREQGIEVCLFVGPLVVLGKMKAAGDLPADFVLKISVTLAAANPATARVLEDLGATSINLPVDLALAQIAAIRRRGDRFLRRSAGRLRRDRPLL